MPQVAAEPEQFSDQSMYWWNQVPTEKVDQIEEGALVLNDAHLR